MSTTTATKNKNRKIESNELQFFQGLLRDFAGNYVKLAIIKSKNRINKTCSEYGYFLKDRIIKNNSYQYPTKKRQGYLTVCNTRRKKAILRKEITENKL